MCMAFLVVCPDGIKGGPCNWATNVLGQRRSVRCNGNMAMLDSMCATALGVTVASTSKLLLSNSCNSSSSCQCKQANTAAAATTCLAQQCRVMEQLIASLLHATSLPLYLNI
jgi:hypothetical protein